MRRVAAYLALLMAPLWASAQVYDPQNENIIERKVETVAEQSDDDQDFTTMMDEMVYYLEHPLNINRASYQDLEQLNMLDDITINNLLDHIKKHGKLLNIYELQTVNGFDLPLIRKIQPFIKVNDDPDKKGFSFRDMFKEGKHETLIRYTQVLEEQVGYSAIDDSVLALNPNQRYLGDPYRLMLRYRFQYGNRVSWGLTAEKDPGEEFFTGSNKQGFDYYSAHFFVRNIGFLKALAIGDYQAQFGQGLTMWSGLAFGKTADGISIKRTAVGLRPYASVGETNFLRGGAFTLGFGKFEFTAFGSYRWLDGNVSVVDTTSNEIEVVTSIQTSGYHRTPNELIDRNSVSQQAYGGNVAFRTRKLKVGLTGVYYMLSSDLLRGDALYQKFVNIGTYGANFGVDYSWVWRNFHFFGEFAMDHNKAFATTHGVYLTLDPRVSIGIMYRNFSKEYVGMFSNPIQEGNGGANEQGYYLGYNIQPIKNFTLSGYFDVFRFPWLTYLTNSPSTGYEVMSQLTFRPSKTLDITARFRQKLRQLNTSSTYDPEPIQTLEDQLRTYYRLTVTFSLSKTVKLRSRVEYSRYRRGDDDAEDGFIAYQDVSYDPLKFPVSFSGRIAWFDTDSYNTRIYTYENDVLYAYSLPAYYYQGLRSYLTVRVTPYKGIDVWLRIGNTLYSNQQTVGSGLDMINGTSRTEFKAQVRFKF